MEKLNSGITRQARHRQQKIALNTAGNLTSNSPEILASNGTITAEVLMATLKALQVWWAGVVPEPQTSFQRMVELAAEKGVTLTVDEVKSFLKQMDKDEEFDDIELDAVALSAVAGGFRRGRGGC